MALEVRTCSRCVMDQTDPDIQFDEHGVCNHCHTYEYLVRTRVKKGEVGQAMIERMVHEIRKDGQGKDFDCIIGVSGGVDSTFAAYKVKELGLRPLAVHLDNGWDSELAVKNIENVLKKLDIELYTHVIDWEEFRDLQLAFLRASTPDSEIPTDHAIFALLRQMAEKVGVRHIISGFNVRCETHLPPAWSQGHLNWKYIQTVHRRFGSVPLRTFPHMTFVEYLRFQWSIRWWDILDYLDYSKTQAMEVLKKECGWRYYGGKHYESIYTRFYQGYILPKKFGFDKRKCHLSSLICSGEITRGAAIGELQSPPYPLDLQEEDRVYVIKKFGISDAEFQRIMSLPAKSIVDYYRLQSIRSQPFYRFARYVYQWVKAFVVPRRES